MYVNDKKERDIMKRFIVFIAAMMIAMGVFGAATLDSGIPTDLEILVTAQNLYDYDVLTVDNLVALDILDRDTLRGLDLIMPLNNFAATATPEASMDVTEGYEVGSFWYDTTNDVMYSCIDSTTDTAVWFPMAVQTALPLNNFAATATPEASMDVTEGYEVGSFWYDTTNDVMYSCIDSTTDTAVWFPMAVQTALPLNNYAATAAPNATDSSYNGYSVGSIWIDTTADNFYICLDDTSLSGVWTVAAGDS